MNLTKPVTRAEMIEIQIGNTRHIPIEALDVPLRPGWKRIYDICGITHKIPTDKCFHHCWWDFKEDDVIDTCTLCEGWANDPG